MTKRALITGITGQDGSYLAELLLAKGYEVHGLIRRSSSFATTRIDHLYHDPHESGSSLTLHYGDLTDPSSLLAAVHKARPDELYNLGAQSHVKVSFEMPGFTAETAAMGALHLLEAIRTVDWPIRFYQAGSSEMFGRVREVPQNERTPLDPRSPYAAAKAFAHSLTTQYREGYGAVRGQRHPVQPRVAAPRRDLRHPQDHPRGRGHHGRHAVGALPRQSRRGPRLGLCRRVRGGDVADAPAAGRRTNTSSPPARCTRCGSS